MNILGISAYYHDSAAALLRDGELHCAAQQERFSRKKHDASFPAQAIEFCLREGGVSVGDLSCIVFYEKPLLKFERLLETYLGRAPRGFSSFQTAMRVWLKEKLNLKGLLKKELATIANVKVRELPPLLFTEHHQAHAASAFFPSPFGRAAVICCDGVGEWATTSVWLGENNRLTPQWEVRFPDSLGLLYSAFTYFAGFKVNSGEYKLMGLAPYGEPRYAALIRDQLIDIKADGTFRLNTRYFDYETGLRMTNAEFDRLIGGRPRKPEEPLTQREMDLAASIQVVTEEAMLRLAQTARRELDAEYLCLAGGVALNCVANGRLLREAGFRDIWIQPAAGDAGGAVGAAWSAFHEYFGQERRAGGDRMRGAFLGPRYDESSVRSALDAMGATYVRLDDEVLLPKIAELLDGGSVVGWFSGPMEFGPRALGARSILGDARNPRMQSTMNLKIKFRESFRPFAPSVLAERVSDYFEIDRATPYMLLVASVAAKHRRAMTPEQEKLTGIEKLNVVRSTVPAVTHVDYSARIQTVHADTNRRFHALLRTFEERTGCPVLVNTSFNVRGEPIVCRPEDAYRCFMATGMDYLVVEQFLLDKREQSVRAVEERSFEPD